MPDLIPSPYYFVPLSEQVFYPDWGPKVQHDMPFRDGISGELTIQINSHRPIYVRSQAPKPSVMWPDNPGEEPKEQGLRPFKDNDDRLTDRDWSAFHAWISFATNQTGEFEIPGTAVHGVIRNVLKIAGFGSMREAQSDERFAVRDFALHEFKKEFVSGNKQSGICFKAQSGWLVHKDGEWLLYECAHHRVDMSQLEMLSIRAVTESALKATEKATNSVSAKYALWRGAGMSLDIDHSPGTEMNQMKNSRHLNKRLPLIYRYAATVGSGTAKGTLVFTGQPSSTKHMEFIFGRAVDAMTKKPVKLNADGEVKRFLAANAEGDAWAHWRTISDSGDPIPVFYLKQGTKVKELGLAQLFRLPASRTLSDGIPEAHKAPGKYDLADLIFGTLHGESKQHLKGRTSFSAFTAQEKPQPLGVQWTILGAPRPTFYPNYLKQDTEPQGNTLRVTDYFPNGDPKFVPWSSLLSPKDKEIRLSGWKRYAIWRDWETGFRLLPELHTVADDTNIASATAFDPLPAHTMFVGKIRFHNLKLAELGALIWAIEWGGGSDLRHSVGMAKGIGFGSVSMRIVKRGWTTTFGGKEVTAADATTAFTTLMSAQVPGWEDSVQLQELRLLADQTASFSPRLLAYPKLAIGQPHGDAFREAKGAKLVLPRYSQALKLATARANQQ